MTLELAQGEIHAWFASLDTTAELTDRFRITLADDELARAARFHFDRDRNHYIAGRGILRDLLARYLDTEPARVSFLYGGHGKPALAGPWEPSRIRFNLSHSHGHALYSFTLDREIGCDIEQFRPAVLREQIADRFFSPREAACLRALDPDSQLQGFFNCWTRKEAWIKARSHGMSIPLDSFDVTLAPGDEPQLVATRPDAAEAARWTIHALEAPPGFAAAIAVEGEPDRIIVREWEPAP